MLSRPWPLLAIALVSCRAASAPIPEARADLVPSPSPHAAVVELFTSEGCSSCPPADAVLERVTRQALAAGHPIIPLSFHVDYWDGLGWPDRFSSPDCTARQRDYARAFGESDLYTPQMVVGGTLGFIGSDEERAETSIKHVRAAEVDFTLRVARTAPDTLAVHYDVQGPLPDRALLFVAVVQRSATVHVAAGENAGRTLRHTSIVRAFTSAPLGAASGDRTVRAPWAPAHDEADVVAFVQRTVGSDAMTILGAATSAIP